MNNSNLSSIVSTWTRTSSLIDASFPSANLLFFPLQLANFAMNAKPTVCTAMERNPSDAISRIAPGILTAFPADGMLGTT